MTLVEFLAARWAEDEGDALAACQGGGYRDWDVPSTGVVQVAGGDLDGLVLAPRNAALHMARHDPARVLRRVAADRSILDKYRSLPRASLDYRKGQLHAYDMVLRLLALPYVQHPDYDPAWRP
jgi:hypothetical protein